MIMTAEAQIKDIWNYYHPKPPYRAAEEPLLLQAHWETGLGQMVVHLTLGKKRYAQAEQDMLNYEES